MLRASLATVVLAGLAGLTTLACASDAWLRAREADTPAAYRRFLSESPRSAHAAEARERLDYLIARRQPTPESLDRFRAAHSESPLAADLERLAEQSAFDAARATGTAAAYEAFLARFPAGANAARARGNAAYLAAEGFAGRPDALASFAAEHPESDFAAQAGRALEQLRTQPAAGRQAVGLRVEIAAGTPEAERLRRAFEERARELHAEAGSPLLVGRDGPGGTVVVRHAERAVPTEVYEGRVVGPGVLAETRVSLERPGATEPDWSERFTLRVPEVEHRGGGSVLFGPRASRYWSRFFVPVSSPSATSLVGARVPLDADAVAVAADVGRALVLHRDGSVQEVDLADPAQPRVLGRYRRDVGLARFRGLRVLRGRIVTFGDDGVEVLARTSGGLARVHALGREEVGDVAGVAAAGDSLLVAGSRGLLRSGFDAGPVESLAPMPLRGVAVDGGSIYALEERALLAAPLSAPAALTPVVELGRAIAPRSLRVEGGVAVVIGERDVLCLALAGAGPARPLSRLRAASVGRVRDAALLGGTVFLLGDRGLQAVDPFSGRSEGVGVEGRLALDTAGRHVVVVGSGALQTVEATRWISRGAPARLAR